MTSNAEIVEEVVEKGYIDNALRIYRVHSSHYDDLYQEVVVILLSMDNDRLNDIMMCGKLSHFIVKVVKHQYMSTTSSFYKQYRKHEKTTVVPDGWDIADED